MAGVALQKVEFVHGTNADAALMLANIQTNMAQAAKAGCATFNGKRGILVAGGPSANDHIDEIAKYRSEGWEVWCVNGAHDWLRAKIRRVPDVCVMMDATELVDKFVTLPMSGVRYLLASQTHPKMVRRMIKAGADVTLWHAALDDEAHEVMGEATITAPANTVGLHALQLMLLSGIRNARVYGMDSSHRPGADHAYDNSHQNHADELEFVFKGEMYRATGTWAAQASIFRKMYPKFVRAGMRITVVGDGLLPAMWRDAHDNLVSQLMDDTP